MTVSDPGAGQQQGREVRALVCPFCGSKLWVDTRTEGSGYMSYEVPDAIACDGACDVEWNTDGTVRTEPKWVRHPDLFDHPAPSPTPPARDSGRDEAREAVARWLSAAVDGPTFWNKSSGWDDANRYQSGYLQEADELLALPELDKLLRRPA